jgi:enoyl-CoA hydratase/carnithine racemase
MEVLAEIRNRIAFVTLNRPAALNALSLAMIVELRACLRRFACDPQIRAVVVRGAGDKAFCAGGDIRALYESYRTAGSLHEEFFAREYPLDYLLHHYPKPYLAWMDGIVMGGGMGLAQGSRLRVVGDRTRMAMPEVGIGFFPDVGGSYFLSRLPGRLGEYLALTGAQIRAADALYVGLADYFLNGDAAARLADALQAISWRGDPRHDTAELQRALAGLAADAGPAPLAEYRAAIDVHFAAPDIGAICASLRQEARPAVRDWAQRTLQVLESRSPTMLAVTHRQLDLGRGKSLADCLRMEIGMAARSLAQGDFMEGVRAVVIDKDNAPRWNPATLAELEADAVSAVFDDPWAGGTHPLSNIENEVTSLCN